MEIIDILNAARYRLGDMEKEERLRFADLTQPGLKDLKRAIETNERRGGVEYPENDPFGGAFPKSAEELVSKMREILRGVREDRLELAKRRIFFLLYDLMGTHALEDKPLPSVVDLLPKVKDVLESEGFFQ